jgi:hypothetical protein
LTIRYTPDTCDCIIDLSHDTITIEEWVQKCQMHKDFDGKKLKDKVFDHNKSIGVVTSDNPTLVETVKAMKECAAEKKRIRGMGKPIINKKLKNHKL